MIPIFRRALTLFDGRVGSLTGEGVSRTVRRLKDLAGVFADERAFAGMDPETVVYEVDTHDACGEVEGGLYFGVSSVSPGKVGDEYFMTKGHFHRVRDRGEYYWGIQGNGLLLLMDEARSCQIVEVSPGSLHYIPGRTAHRLINTGSERLAVGACWPSDAGHDYASIRQDGFSVRVRANGPDGWQAYVAGIGQRNER